MKIITHWKRVVTSILLTALVVGPARAADAPKKPNILFLFSDDQRADAIAALGNRHIQTPNLDRLARQGTACTRAYCMGAQQGAVCVPSRAMLMSGRTLFRVSTTLKDQATWPEMFAKAGYATMMTGKWHNGPESARRSFAEGKVVFFGGMGNPYQLPVQDFQTGGDLTAARPSGQHSVELFADRAVEFLKRQHGERPFLCYVAFNAPHDPRLAPKEYHERYNAAKPPVPANFLPQHPFNNGDLIGRDERLAPWPRTPEIVRQQHLADYYAAITFLDAQVGRILDVLQASGQYENTLIVFSSDHGLAIGSHGLFGKQNLYDHSMHAPLIFAGPGVPKGRQTTALCYLLDIFPTLGDLAGVTGPAGSEGKSLAPVFAGKVDKVRDTLVTAYRNLQRAVRDDRWKLLVYPQVNKVQLFDLANDPAEMKDLSADKGHAALVERLTALLKEGQQQLGDTQPLRSDKPQPLEFDFRKVGPERKPGPAKEKAGNQALLTEPPRMPDYGKGTPPAPRSRQEVQAVLAGAPEKLKTRPLHIVLVAGKKDHGRGEHDYPAWRTVWRKLLEMAADTKVTTANDWPDAKDLRSADVLVFYQQGRWTPERAKLIDAFLARGGGLVYIHYAVDGGKDSPGFAQRIGLTWQAGQSRFRHGPVDLGFKAAKNHPIARNFDKVHLHDESYWNLAGDTNKVHLLATGMEEGKEQPLFWTLEPSKGRVFVSIPGHFAWTFDDPLFRILLLRGIAWVAREPVDRFNELVIPGARIEE